MPAAVTLVLQQVTLHWQQDEDLLQNKPVTGLGSLLDIQSIDKKITLAPDSSSVLLHCPCLPITFSPAGYISDFAQGDVDRVLALTDVRWGVTSLCLSWNVYGLMNISVICLWTGCFCVALCFRAVRSWQLPVWADLVVPRPLKSLSWSWKVTLNFCQGHSNTNNGIAYFSAAVLHGKKCA